MSVRERLGLVVAGLFLFVMVLGLGTQIGHAGGFFVLLLLTGVSPLLAALPRRDSIFFVVSVVFLTQGASLILGSPSFLWEAIVHEGGISLSVLYKFLRFHSIFGIPVGLLYLSISSVWSKRRGQSAFPEQSQVLAVLLLIIVWVILKGLLPSQDQYWADVPLLGSAIVALIFTLVNFRRSRSTDPALSTGG